MVANNILTGNALPDVAFHTHAPFQGLSGHLIVGNQISGNGPDSDPMTTVPTGISIFSPIVPLTGIVISQNIIKGENIAITVNAPGAVEVRFNSLFGDVGIDNIGTAGINAAADWWKCSGGPGANGCSTVLGNGVVTQPWLTKPF